MSSLKGAIRQIFSVTLKSQIVVRFCQHLLHDCNETIKKSRFRPRELFYVRNVYAKDSRF